jgi:hypothetical protein
MRWRTGRSAARCLVDEVVRVVDPWLRRGEEQSMERRERRENESCKDGGGEEMDERRG